MFPPFTETRFAGSKPESPEERPGPGLEQFPAETKAVTWWGHLDDRYDGYAKRLRVRWLGPRGMRLETPVQKAKGDWVRSVLELPPEAIPATWKVEVVYQDDVLERGSFGIQPPI